MNHSPKCQQGKKKTLLYMSDCWRKRKIRITTNRSRGTRNLNMHLYGSRSLTEHYICLAQNKIKLTKKEMLVYVQKKRKQLDYIMVGRKMITHRNKNRITIFFTEFLTIYDHVPIILIIRVAKV